MKRLSLLIPAFLTILRLLAQPANDEICDAAFLFPTDSCNFQTFDNTGATGSFSDGQCYTHQDHDVWFKTIVPSSGKLNITLQSNDLTDVILMVYTSIIDCGGNLTLVACSYNNGPNGLPQLELESINPGTELYIRVFDYFDPPGFMTPGDPYEFGQFEICIESVPDIQTINFTGNCNSNQAGDDCLNATPICSINGYCGSTTGFSNSTWIELNNEFCGSIENNSFLKFNATEDSLNLNLSVSGDSSLCPDGIQFFAFTTPNCGGAVTNISCQSPVPMGIYNFDLTGLTIGQEYYLMIDGYAGDICDYQINVSGGTLADFNISGLSSICLGDTLKLKTDTINTGSIVWSGNDIVSTNNNELIAYPTAPGIYTYIAEAVGYTPLCGSNIDTFQVEVINTQFNRNYSISSVACTNEQVIELTIGPMINCNWISNASVNPNYGTLVNIMPSTQETYFAVISDTNGCILIDTLIVGPQNNANIDTSVYTQNEFLFSNQNFASYQWIDCNNGQSPIIGATNQFFNPPYSGNFAVIVSSGTCIDTSFCHFHDGCNDLMIQPTNIVNPTPGMADGEIEFVGYGGTPTYSYLWNDGFTDSIRTQLDTGMYQINITDQNLCSDYRIIYLFDEDTSLINYPPTLTLTSDVLDICIPFNYTDVFVYDYYENGSGELIVRWAFVDNNNNVFLQEVNYGPVPTTITNINVQIDLVFYCQNGSDNNKQYFSFSAFVFIEKNSSLETIEFDLQNFKLYPNPTEDFIFYEIPSSFELQWIGIIDARGKLLKKIFTDINNNKLDVPFSKGIYYFQFQLRNGMVTKKVVKN